MTPRSPEIFPGHQKQNLATHPENGKVSSRPVPPQKMAGDHFLAPGTPAIFLPLALIAFAVILLYLPTSAFPFINLDDGEYVYQNQHVTQGVTAEGVKWAFLPDAKKGTYWHPLAWISLMLDVEIFGVNPGAHHTINWLIHLANAILLFFLIKNTTGYLWRSTFIALIFAVHPVNLESVVWIAERKNVLSTFFCFTTLLSYTSYANQRTWARYLAVLAFYALGLLSKPVLVTLPALLLLLDFWPLHRFNPAAEREPGQTKPGMIEFASENSRLLLEKVPFFILAMAVLIFSFKAVAHQGMTVTFQTVPLSLRLENAATSLVAYLCKLSYPANLAVFHPFPAHIPTWQVILSALLLGLLTALAYYHRRSRPWFTFGWCWFLISLLPVSGIIQAGLWPKMAYRWLYLPELGIFLIIVWALTELADRLNIGLRTRATGVVLILVLLMSSAYKQMQYWRDSTTLLKQALEAGGPHPVIYDYLGRALLTKKQPLVAIEYLNRSLEIAPGLDTALSDLGTAYALLNQLDLAIEYFEQALKINPDLADAGNNLKNVSQNKQRFEERANATLKALGESPDSPELLNRLGYDYFNLGRMQAASDCYEKSLRLDPGNKRAFNELGRMHLLYGRSKESLAFFEEALRIDPNFSEARQNLSRAERILSEIRE